MRITCTFRNMVRVDKKLRKIEKAQIIKDPEAREIAIKKIQDEPEQIKTELQKCGSYANIKVIEFKHPDYPELSEYEYLCDSHFEEVFGDIRNEEQKAYRDWRNQVFRYKKDFAQAQKYAEYFNAKDFYTQNYNKVEHKKIIFDNIKRKICRYEYCETKLETIRRIYRIIVSRVGGIDFKSYFYCGKPHWEKMKFRIHPKIEIDKKKMERKGQSLLEYT